MDISEPLQRTYIVIIERTPEMRILYASSSIRESLLIDPDEMRGHSSLEFMIDSSVGEAFKSHHGFPTDDNVLITNMFIKLRSGRRLFVRSIAFVCDNVTFHMTTAYPGIAFEQHGQPLSIQRFKCILDENEGEQQQSSGQGSQASAAARRGFDMNRAYSTRSARQACIVLEGIIEGSSEAITGPRVTFVTNSISQIIDADSSDIQGLPFLSLVATEDITKAAAFLDNALSSNELVLENFRLLADPVDPNSRRSRELVSAEFMAMASDDGVNILCQLGKNESARRGPAGRYMSLDEIISSDPETSGFSEAWNRFSLR